MCEKIPAEKVEQPVHDCSQPKQNPTLVDARSGSSIREPKSYSFVRNGHGFVGKPPDN